MIKHAGKILTVFCVTLCITKLQAQFAIGLQGIYTHNYLNTNNANRDFTNYRPQSGFGAGIPVQYTLAGWFAVQAEPSYIQKNYRQERSSFFQGVYQTNTNAYIQLPVMAHFMFGGEKLGGFFNLGGYGGYWVTGNIKGSVPNILDPVDDPVASNTFYEYTKPYMYNEKYGFDTRRDNRIEAGWVAGAGVSYNLNTKYQLFAEGRYTQAVTDQQKAYMLNQSSRYNETYSASLGVMMHFTHGATSTNQ